MTDEERDDGEPQCYYTGRGYCGDCRDPATNLPLGCFDRKERKP